MKMESIRKWFYKPKRDDPSLLAQFFYADEALNLVAAELDSFDGRKDPERCTALVNHLRQCQDKVLTICNRIMDDVIPTERANRDFRVKFPDDVMQENLAGQLWFGAECLAAGSSIMNRECESAAMRPLAKALTKALENVRNLLREQCLRGNTSTSSLKPNPLNGVNEVFSERLQEALKIFDRLFAEFELSYVSAMVPVKSIKEYELQQLVVVLFSETLQRALKMKLLTQDMVDDYDPALMFTIPRLAIVSGLLIFPDGPLRLDGTPADMSEMFRPFRTLLFKIRELLWTLNNKELFTLEKLLCSSEEPGDFKTSDAAKPQILEAAHSNSTPSYPTVPDIDLDEFITHFYIDHPSCKQFMTDFYATDSERTNGDPPVEIEETRNVLHWEDICKMSTSTEESEDETEWVGETSECETVVITDTCSNNGAEESAEADLKTTVLPEVCSPVLGLTETLVFGEHVIPENSSPMSEAVDSQIQSNIPLSENIEIPTPSTTGFLLANQVGQSILASIERTAFPRLPDLSPSASESLPDGDSHEAMSAATATLSNLLYRTPSPASPASSPKIELEDDSGVGTVLNVSDISMSSGKSLDIRRVAVGSTSSTSEAAYQRWQVETIPCNCSLSNTPTTSGESSKHQKSSYEESQKNINGTDLCCDSNIKQLEETDLNHRSKIKSVLQSENTNNVNFVHKVNSYQSTVSQDIKRMCQDGNRTDSSQTDLKQVSSRHVLPVHPKTKSVPSITVNAENFGAHREEEWQGMAVGEGHCTVCSGSEDWQHLISKPPPGQAQEENRTTPISSLMRKKETENGKEKVVTNVVEPAVRNSRPALAVVPSHSGTRNLEVPLASSYSSTCSSCQSSLTASSDSCSISSETSSFNSECQDDEEIALAMQAAEIASRNEARAKFRSSEDLVHRLFVCIAGVADQLQTNFAGDLRHILKSVFLMSASCSPEALLMDGEETAAHTDLLAESDAMRPVESAEEALSAGWEAPASPIEVESPPPWIPDELAPRCMSCEAVFTVVRRRHHCRNCGKVFCARCSSNSVPLPRFGHVKPVRVCNRCFLYQVTPFTLEELATRS